MLPYSPANHHFTETHHLPAHYPHGLFSILFSHSSAFLRAVRLDHRYHSGVRPAAIRQPVNAGRVAPAFGNTARGDAAAQSARPTRDMNSELTCAKRCGVETSHIPHLSLDGLESKSPYLGHRNWGSRRKVYPRERTICHSQKGYRPSLADISALIPGSTGFEPGCESS